jgi:hypothetical protein
VRVPPKRPRGARGGRLWAVPRPIVVYIYQYGGVCCGVVTTQGAGLALGTEDERLVVSCPFLHPWCYGTIGVVGK